MKKFTIALIGIFIFAGMSGPAQSSQVTAKKYSSCADVLKKYPNGVAKNKKARNEALKGGFVKPKVSKVLYKKNSKRLDKNNDGIICRQKKTEPLTKAEPFTFAKNIDPSLPADWVAEFNQVMSNLGQLMPISERINEVPVVQSPFNIYAWNSAVSNPFPQIPGAQGASISGNGLTTWMVLEIPESELRDKDLHRYKVIAHEYFHVYQIAMSRDAEGTQWLWEGGAKVVEELYSQQFYGRSQFDSQLMPVNAAAVQTPTVFENYGSGKDNNYYSSAFLVLALAKELQRRGMSEELAFTAILRNFQDESAQEPDWKKAFVSTFNMTVEEFYQSLSQYPTAEPTEDWVRHRVVDAAPVLPSKTLTLNSIFN
ncbi:MAG: excalibur calcium-binding domain-containing protein [Candidatus Nanopelagicales bacterium]|nr:excalibur calcium-binding domain-containing protein [Candidatus Nanopelagicales bacterium]